MLQQRGKRENFKDGKGEKEIKILNEGKKRYVKL